MLSHFVRKDAKNWDDYVPYAVMAYRAMPHCSTKYSPYYLVFGRDMRLPIEDDWRPNVSGEKLGDDEYERHVKLLAERLREANAAAGQQSKLSHEVAKRYYDRQTKLEQFSKGDLVYIYDPTYKRSQAKKFSYQYKGPFMIKQKISPLIYKVELPDGAFAIIHVNRLKKAHGPVPSSKMLLTKEKPLKMVGSPNSTEAGGKDDAEIVEPREPDPGVPSHSQVTNTDDTESSETEEEDTSLSNNKNRDSDWEPGSMYLKRMLQSDNRPADIAYRLRSRLVSRSGREKETDKPGAEGSSSAGDTLLLTETSPEESESTTGHSYNLRNRIGPTLYTK